MRGNAARILVWAVTVLGLLGLVTIAATGSTPTGSGETRQAPYVLFDTFMGLVLVGILASVALVVYVFAHRTPTNYQRTRGGLVALVAMLAVAWLLATSNVPAWLQSRQQEREEQRDVGATPNLPEDPDPANRPPFTWLPTAVILSLAVIGIAAMVLAERRRRRARFEREAVEEALVDVLDGILDDLRAEPDARRAVIATYARLERVLAAHGFARRAPETQEEYLARILRKLEVDFQAIRRLTDLFAVAKFSQHHVDERMKEEAIDTLEQVRDELRIAETRHEDERVGARPAGEEPA